MESYFGNAAIKENIERWYHRKIEQLGISYESIEIETSFGKTHLIVTGTDNKPPLVLLHGYFSCAPLTIEALFDLKEDYRIFAIDVIGQPNLSVTVQPSMYDHSYGQWMFEIMTRLDIKDSILVGISFGGFIGWKTLIFDERHISKAFLIAPIGIVKGNLIKISWRLLRPLNWYKKRRKSKHFHRLLKELYTDNNGAEKEFSSLAMLRFETSFSSIPLIKQTDAEKIKTPVSIIAADQDLLSPGKLLIKRAKRIFPSLDKVLLLQNSKHIPNQKGNNLIVKLIKK